MSFESVTIESGDIRRLLGAASGDAALLYLYMRGGGEAAGAREALGFSESRYSCAAAPYPDETSLAGLLSATVSPRPRAMFSRLDRVKKRLGIRAAPSVFPPFGWGWNENAI